ncbi:MAG: DNA gyrase inhibitor YacG [Rickettsiales bacterium]
MTCPVCFKPTKPEHKPFCSERCRQVDLNKWFTGSYAVPAVELDDVDDESLAAAEALLNGSPEDQ